MVLADQHPVQGQKLGDAERGRLAGVVAGPLAEPGIGEEGTPRLLIRDVGPAAQK